MLINEMYIMKKANHPCIVQWRSGHFKDNYIWVVMELMESGCLADILEHHGELVVSEPQMSRIILDVRSKLSVSSFVHFGRCAKRSHVYIL